MWATCRRTEGLKKDIHTNTQTVTKAQHRMVLEAFVGSSVGGAVTGVHRSHF